MATLQPFRALRPKPELAAQICELPYDVLSSAEARQQAAGNALSFFHVSKPEIDLAEGTDPHSPAVYAKGRENLDRLVAEGALYQEAEARFYFYRQVMGKHAQTGLVAVSSCQEYLDGVIRIHEATRPEKEDDRVRHMEALDAQTGPVFLTYPAQAEVDALCRRVTGGAPEVDFTAPDGVRHTAWSVGEAVDRDVLVKAFEAVPRLYIADGHHRSAAAGRVYQDRKGAGNSGFFLTVIFPHDQMQILAYNRLVKDLNGLEEAAFLERLRQVAEEVGDDLAVPEKAGEFGVYLGGRWRRFRFPATLRQGGKAVAALDVALLQRHVLHGILGIEDPRVSDRIEFVGGIRGTGELEKRVASGDGVLAFSMFPTRIEDLMAVSDAGDFMPPKSTWFEPKLRDAMFSHCL